MSAIIDNSYFDCLGENIRKKRKELDLSQQQLADTACCTRQTIIEIESGKTIPKFETVIQICKALDNCSIDYLTGHDSCSTHDLQGVCNYTGLSELAAKKLHFYKNQSEELIKTEKRIKKEYYPDSLDEEELNKMYMKVMFPLLEEDDYSPISFEHLSFEKVSSKIIENEKLIELIKEYDRLLSNAENTIENAFFSKISKYEGYVEDIVDNYDNDEDFESSFEVRMLHEIEYEKQLFQNSIISGLKLSLAEEVVNIIESTMPSSLRKQQMNKMKALQQEKILAKLKEAEENGQQ